MKTFALLALLLLLSACVQQQPQAPEAGTLGIGEEGDTGLEELPEETTEEEGLLGEPMDLGPLT